jgi:hypothetical protein
MLFWIISFAFTGFDFNFIVATVAVHVATTLSRFLLLACILYVVVWFLGDGQSQTLRFGSSCTEVTFQGRHITCKNHHFGPLN